MWFVYVFADWLVESSFNTLPLYNCICIVSHTTFKMESCFKKWMDSNVGRMNKEQFRGCWAWARVQKPKTHRLQFTGSSRDPPALRFQLLSAAFLSFLTQFHVFITFANFAVIMNPKTYNNHTAPTTPSFLFSCWSCHMQCHDCTDHWPTWTQSQPQGSAETNT